MSFHNKRIEGRGVIREKRLEIRKLLLKARLCVTLPLGLRPPTCQTEI